MCVRVCTRVCALEHWQYICEARSAETMESSVAFLFLTGIKS